MEAKFKGNIAEPCPLGIKKKFFVNMNMLPIVERSGR